MATSYPRWHLEFFFIHVAIPTEEACAGPHQPAKCAGEGNIQKYSKSSDFMRETQSSQTTK